MIGADQGPAYPGIPNHEPNVEQGRRAAEHVRRNAVFLREIGNGAYLSESNYFDENSQNNYWGNNHNRLAQIKQKYDPDDLFYVHNGVGSEQWSNNGFTRQL